MQALTISQPWAWLIVHGWKRIENRSWPTNYRGPSLVHAGQKRDEDAWKAMMSGRHPVTGRPILQRLHQQFATDWKAKNIPCGGFVGTTEIVDCIHVDDVVADAYKNEWFVGPYGFVLRGGQPMPFMPFPGRLKFFHVHDDIVRPALRQ